MKFDDKFLDDIKNEFIRCRGDIYKRNLDGEDMLVCEGEYLQYDTINGTFFREADISYVSSFVDAVIDKDLDKIEELNDAIEEHFLYTDIPSVNGMLYIDKGSICEIKDIKCRK